MALDAGSYSGAPLSGGLSAWVANWLQLLRPPQWAKNAFVFAPLVFSQRFFEPGLFWRAALTFVALCLASSAAYVFNDVLDRERDREHPQKALRPIASGRIAPETALVVAGLLAVIAIATGWMVSGGVAIVVVAFVSLQLLYSASLKHIVFIDVAAIAFGFVLRASAGVLAVDAVMSSWLLGCTFLLALFLALGKRRRERIVLESDAHAHRRVLGDYDGRKLDAAISIAAGSTLGCYILYCLSPAVAENLQTDRLFWTIPFVVFGVLRYLFVVYKRDGGGNPTDVLLGDWPLQTSIIVWLAVVWILLYG